MDIREKLIELLGNIYLPIMAGSDTIGECSIPHKFKREIADYLIANGVTVQEWISVDDRLPKNGVRVLVAHDDGVVRIGICRGYFPAIVSKNHTKTFGIAEVTHWTPLPELPKGE